MDADSFSKLFRFISILAIAAGGIYVFYLKIKKKKLINKIYENRKRDVELKCANCAEPFKIEDSVCSKCSKDISREKECYELNDKIEYEKLLNEFHPNFD